MPMNALRRRLGSCGIAALAIACTAAEPKTVPASNPPVAESLALTVPDRGCPNLVRPFDISGNVEKLGALFAQDKLDETIQKHDSTGKFQTFKNILHIGKQAKAADAQGTSADSSGADGAAPAGAPDSAPANSKSSHSVFGSITAAIKNTVNPSAGSAAAAGTGGGDISADMRRQIKQMDWLPMAAEVEYGRRNHQQELDDILGRETKEGKKLYPIADAMLQRALDKVGEPTEYNFQLFILKTDDHNAIARPGGFVYVDAGLIKDPTLRPKAEFALAHEIAHVLQRHETLELQGVIVDSFAFRKDLLDAVSKMRDNPSSVLERIKLDKNQYVRYRIDQELQADSCATRLLGRVYGNSADLANSLRAFLADLPPDTVAAVSSAPSSTPATSTKVSAVIAESQSSARVTEEIVNEPANSHPSSSERRKNLTAMYAEVESEIASRDPAAGAKAHPSQSQPARKGS
jgi:Zn-dependent protease with chaperone function